MKNHLFTFLLILHSFVLTAQKAKVISNSKSPKHVPIQLSQIFLVAPEGFKQVDFLAELQKDETTKIGASHKVNTDFNSEKNFYTKENLEVFNYKLLEKQELVFQGFKGLGVLYSGNGGSNQYYNLIFGDSTFTMLLYGEAPTSDKGMMEKIKASIQGAVYDPKFKADYMEAARFYLDDSKSRFKLIKPKQLQVSYLYTVNGIIPEDPINEPLYNVRFKKFYSGHSMKLIAEEQTFVVKGRTYQLDKNSLKHEFSGTVNGYEVYEHAGYVNTEEVKRLFYVFIATDHTTLVIIQAFSRSEYEKNLQEFKGLSRTLKIK